MTNLQELTGQESGIVIYYGNDGGQPEAVVCNWSSVQGFPRVDPFGLTVLGFGEDIQEDIDGISVDNIPAMLEDVQIVFANGEDMPEEGKAFVFDDDNITVIAPDGWA